DPVPAARLDDERLDLAGRGDLDTGQVVTVGRGRPGDAVAVAVVQEGVRHLLALLVVADGALVVGPRGGGRRRCRGGGGRRPAPGRAGQAQRLPRVDEGG